MAKSNRVIKRKMVDVYGAVDMLTGFEADERELTYHHLEKKEYGGQQTIDNGALLLREMHQWLHALENEHLDLFNLVNDCLMGYKSAIDANNINLIAQYWEECLPELQNQYFHYIEEHGTQKTKTRKRR